MNRLSPLFFLVMLGTSLLAQSVDSNAVREESYLLITLTKYCAGLETLSDSQQPRMFAQVSSGLGLSSGWAEFESKTEWRQASKPKPLALVWYRDNKVVRVAITADGDDARSYADYCYRANGSLAQFRSVPAVQTTCDQSLFHCNVTFRGLRQYPPKEMLVAPLAQRHGQEFFPVVPAQYFDLFDLLFSKPLKPEKATFSFAVDWPEYLSVWDLPFNRLLYVSKKTTK